MLTHQTMEYDVEGYLSLTEKDCSPELVILVLWLLQRLFTDVQVSNLEMYRWGLIQFGHSTLKLCNCVRKIIKPNRKTDSTFLQQIISQIKF